MSDLKDIEALVARGQKIHAIKEFRSSTGVGLRQAKEAVEWFQSHGRWPAQYLGSVDAEPARAESLRRDVEREVAAGKKIAAIKRLREITGWGLRATKDAVDRFLARGSWSSEVLAVLDEVAPSPGDSPGPGASPSSQPASPSSEPTLPSSQPASFRASGSDVGPSTRAADSSSDPRVASMLRALAEHLGHAPDVRLRAAALRLPYRGQLVVLRDRTCFLHEDRGRWVVDPVLSHDAVTHVEVDTGARPALYVSIGYRHERFELEPTDAEAALALLRVFAG